eukprot:5235093-Lingulodinium_polyedra.AAC.2
MLPPLGTCGLAFGWVITSGGAVRGDVKRAGMEQFPLLMALSTASRAPCLALDSGCCGGVRVVKHHCPRCTP